MAKTFKVFTTSAGTVEEGAKINTLTLKGAGIEIPAIIVGEEGRGRSRGVLPVVGLPAAEPCPHRGTRLEYGARKCTVCGAVPVQTIVEGKAIVRHPNRGEVLPERLLFAQIGQTRKGKPSLIWADRASSSSEVIVVFRTPIGFRGGNNHTGDRNGWKCCTKECNASGSDFIRPDTCPECGEETQGGWDRQGPIYQWLPRPGQLLIKGTIAQGAAGAMGSGEQLVLLLGAGEVVRTVQLGRLYGAPASHYYRWDGENLLGASAQERELSDLF